MEFDINIRGVSKSSYIDYPGKISTVIFLGGCNFRCPYCHNSDIVKNIPERIDTKEIIEYLLKRKHLIDSVTITGGEPTLQNDLSKFCKFLKGNGFNVKLDTNGTNYKMLEKLINNNLVDFIAMDIKNSFSKYNETVGKELIDLEPIKRSIEIIKNSNIEHQFRTVKVKGFVFDDDICEIKEYIDNDETYKISEYRYSDKQFVDIDYSKL